MDGQFNKSGGLTGSLSPIFSDFLLEVTSAFKERLCFLFDLSSEHISVLHTLALTREGL